jgi:hypothetical protein
MLANNMHNPDALADRLAEVQEEIHKVTLVACNRGQYRRGQRVPDLADLRRREAELMLRLSFLPPGRRSAEPLPA